MSCSISTGPPVVPRLRLRLRLRSIGNISKPCCGPCLAAWPTWQTNQVNKASNHFWKHNHQICERCVVTSEIESAAVAADAPGMAAPAAAPTPQPLPPPHQLSSNHAMQQFRTMENKKAVLAARARETQVAFERCARILN